MAAVDEQPKLIVILLRLSPAPLPLSYVLGITSIPATTYLFATAIGAFPQLFMSVYIGTFMSSMRAVLKGDTAMPWPMVCFGVTAGIAASVIISAAAKKKIEEATAAAQKEPPTPATIGKIKSDRKSMDYTLYDNGAAPGSKEAKEGQPLRREIMHVHFL